MGPFIQLGDYHIRLEDIVYFYVKNEALYIGLARGKMPHITINEQVERHYRSLIAATNQRG